MNTEEELRQQIIKHTKKMDNVFKNIKLTLNEKVYEHIFGLAKSYFEDSKYFYSKKKLIQSFEALMISWAYIDNGLKLGIFKLLDEKLINYFTI